MKHRSSSGKRTIRKARKALGVEAERALLRFVNGLDWLTRDPSSVVDQTPFDVVFLRDKVQVRRYLPLEEELELGPEALRELPGNLAPQGKHRVPVLLIPPLMVKPLIYDLVDNRSYVRTLLQAGYDVFLLDFGEPDRSDAYVTLDHYILNWIPAAVDAVCRESGCGSLSMIGYCMGGLFALMHASVNQDRRVRNIVTIGSPVDASKMGQLAWFVRLTHDQIDFISRRLGNIPGDLSSAAFKMVAPFKSFTRYADLFINLWNQEYVNDYDALSQWTDNFVDYPGKAFRQLLNDFLVGDKLKDGRWEFGGHAADLGNISSSLLAFAGQDDQIAPVSAIRQILDLVPTEDKELKVVPGGHMGVFGGRQAPAEVWEVSAAWLAARSN